MPVLKCSELIGCAEIWQLWKTLEKGRLGVLTSAFNPVQMRKYIPYYKIGLYINHITLSVSIGTLNIFEKEKASGAVNLK